MQPWPAFKELLSSEASDFNSAPMQNSLQACSLLYRTAVSEITLNFRHKQFKIEAAPTYLKAFERMHVYGIKMTDAESPLAVVADDFKEVDMKSEVKGYGVRKS
jgi:hypothetical protein